jgi:hypothetical protein
MGKYGDFVGISIDSIIVEGIVHAVDGNYRAEIYIP